MNYLQFLIESAPSLNNLYWLLERQDYLELIEQSEYYEPRSFDGSPNPDPNTRAPFLIAWNKDKAIYLDFQDDPREVVQLCDTADFQ